MNDQQQDAARDLYDAAKAMVEWFARLQREQHEKLVLGQTLESASRNWDRGFDASAGFDMTAMQAAVARWEAAPRQAQSPSARESKADPSASTSPEGKHNE